jgi:creatinine amidohydrolase/Fe(II)-dependent formamide hydrolase-like protein
MMSRGAFWFVGRVALTIAVGCSLSCFAEAQVYKLAELNTDQIRKLDRQRTVIILPGGILEEHGPYLPSFTDGYYNERLTKDLSAAIAKRPGWTVVVFPTIPLGSDGANRIGGKYVFPGSYPVRSATLRAIFMDLAAEFGEQGFLWVFVIHAHGSPNHNRVLEQAGNYFHDTYGGQMVHLTGLQPGPNAVDSVLASASKAGLAEEGFSVHAGLLEHSQIQALRPDLVPEAVAKAPSITGRDLADLRRIAARDNWPGYFGAPRYASSELGRRLLEAGSRECIALALRILDGVAARQIPRRPTLIPPELAAIAAANEKRDAAIEERQRQWLARSGQR